MADAFDRHMMGIALTMAQRGLGRTAPNPSVGAVLVEPQSGVVIARATTATGGRPHAEPLAIAEAGDRARGATLYVTLEPCSHHGHTAPCADAIVAAGITRVVCGIEDPDPRVAGRGLARIRAAGIAVERGVRAAEANTLTRGHVCRITQRRPLVVLKLALRADGSVPLAERGAPQFVTSPEARALGHLMRAQTDAILVGSGTILADDPELTCRLPGMRDRSPRRIILARGGLDLTGRRVAPHAAGPAVTVVTGDGVTAGIDVSRDMAGATIIEVPVVGGALWLPSVLERLAESGITRLLVEGGPRIWRAFAEAGLVDDVVLFKAGAAVTASDDADVAGGEPSQAHGGRLQIAARLDIARHLGPLSYQIVDQRRVGSDRVWWFRSATDPAYAPNPSSGPSRMRVT